MPGCRRAAPGHRGLKKLWDRRWGHGPQRQDVITNVSCTTYCAAPIVKVLITPFGLMQGFMTTVHACKGGQLNVGIAGAVTCTGGAAGDGRVGSTGQSAETAVIGQMWCLCWMITRSSAMTLGELLESEPASW